MVLCGKVLTGSNAIIGIIAFGGDSTMPELNLRFNLIKTGTSVRVVAYQWIEAQSGFGQVRRVEVNQPRHFNDVQTFLSAIGGR